MKSVYNIVSIINKFTLCRNYYNKAEYFVINYVYQNVGNYILK